MNAVRRDEELDNLHSIYVDQWDWERVITADQRTLEFLQETVRDIVDAVCATSDELRWKFPELKNNIQLGREVAFITTQESRTDTRTSRQSSARMPLPKSMEPSASCRSAAGSRAASPTTARADYDDWTLNCDILFWHKPLDCALELSSMVSALTPTPAPPAGRRRLPAARGAALPQTAAGWHPAPDNGRRHRPEPPVHAAAGQGPCRRGTGQPVG